MFSKLLKKLGFSKEEASWIMYDIGNSAQTLTAVTVIFPILIAHITPGDSSVYVGWANSIYAAILAIASPILGSIADYKGMKMKMFKFFLYLGIFSAIGLALPFIDYKIALVMFVISMIGYNGSLVFYDAFLVDVTEDDRLDAVSSAGYAWGYIGSTLCFLVFVIPFAAVTLFGDPNGSIMIGNFEFTYRMGCSITMLLAVAWWWFYSKPMLNNVVQKNYHESDPHFIKNSFIHLYETFKNVKQNKNIFLFCLAYFCYIDCVNTVIKMAVSLATDMGVSDVMSLVVVILINFIACPFAILFGYLAKKFGSKPMIMVAIFGYFGVIISGAMIPYNLNFVWAVTLLVGMFQGGIQSVSRSYFAKLIPDKENSNEFFGFFSVFSKFSAIIGPMAISIIVTITKQTNLGILGLIPMMLVGVIILCFVKDPEKQ